MTDERREQLQLMRDAIQAHWDEEVALVKEAGALGVSCELLDEDDRTPIEAAWSDIEDKLDNGENVCRECGETFNDCDMGEGNAYCLDCQPELSEDQ